MNTAVIKLNNLAKTVSFSSVSFAATLSLFFMILVTSLMSMAFVTSTAYAAGAPVMMTTGVSSITENSADLSGYYNDNGSAVMVFFSYGDSPSMDFKTTGVNKSGFGNYGATISKLHPSTTYYFQATAMNSDGVGQGKVLTFKTTAAATATTPVVMTTGQSNVTDSSATLEGYYNSKSSNVKTYFEYGTTSALGRTTDLVNQSDIYGNYSASINGLQSGTKYFFRAVALNAAGTSKASTVLSFTTVAVNPKPQTYECSDGIDNDGDGLIDLGDPACGGNPNGMTESPYNYPQYDPNNGNNNNGGYVPNPPYDPNNPYDPSNYYKYCWDITMQNYGSLLPCIPFNNNNNNNNQNQNNQNNNNQNSGNDTVTVVTNPVVSTTTSGADLSAFAYINGQGSVRVYFEYGTTPNFGSATMSQTINGSSQIQSILYGTLASNTLYYVRAVAINSAGAFYGQTQTFYTTHTTINVPATPRTNIVYASQRSGSVTVAPLQDQAYFPGYSNNYNNNSFFGASAAGSLATFMPHTFGGWLLLIIIILIIIGVTRKIALDQR